MGSDLEGEGIKVMSEALQVDVLLPDSPDEGCTGVVDENLAAQADKLLFDDMPTRDKVWTLHYIYGWPLRKCAKAIGVTYQALYKHRAAIEAELEAAPADPQTPKRRAVVRERLEAQYTRAMDYADTEKSIVFALKTLEVMAKLDGLNLEAQADSANKPVPYGTPPEVAAEVRTLMLERWGRAIPNV